MRDLTKTEKTDWNVPWKNWAEECALELCLLENIKLLCNLINKKCREFVDYIKDRDDLIDAIQRDLAINLFRPYKSTKIKFDKNHRLIAKDANYKRLFINMENYLFKNTWDLKSPKEKKEREAIIEEKLAIARDKCISNAYATMGKHIIQSFIRHETGIYAGKIEPQKMTYVQGDNLLYGDYENEEDGSSEHEKTNIINVEKDPDPALYDSTPPQYSTLDKSDAVAFAKYAHVFWEKIQDEKMRAALFLYLRHANMSDKTIRGIVGIPEDNSTFGHWGRIIIKKIPVFFIKELSFNKEDFTPILFLEFSRSLKDDCSMKWANTSEIGKKLIEYLYPSKTISSGNGKGAEK